MNNNNIKGLECTITSSYGDLQKLAAKVCGRTEETAPVIFSIFEDAGGFEDNDWYVRHPDLKSETPLFDGTCVLSTDYWRITDGDISSSPLTNPTWREVLDECNRHLETGRSESLYLEGFNFEKEENGIKYYRIVWGS